MKTKGIRNNHDQCGLMSCKALAVITGLIVLLGIFFIFDVDRFQEIENFYNDRTRALQSHWIPEFLPKSATNIYEKHNFDYNRVVVSFKFDPADLPALLEGAQEVSADKLDNIGPAWLASKEKWIPQELVTGKVEVLIQGGFRVYEVGRTYAERISNRKLVKWFLLVHPEKGVAYAWS